MENKNNEFFALISRLRYIDRWSLMRNTRKENVAEHSYLTALVAHALCTVQNELFGGDLNADRAAVIALYHDAAEVFTGDMPTPVKYGSDEIRRAYKAMETKAERKLIGYMPDKLGNSFSSVVSPEKSEPEYAFVKYADKIAALIKCTEEVAAGNPEFAAAKESTLATIRGFGIKSVDYFLEHFVEAFGLSLDDSLAN